MTDIKNLHQDQIIEILKNWSINHISFKLKNSGTEVDSDNESDSENEDDYEYWVASETGYLMFYDCKYAHHIKFNNIKLYSNSSRCQTQDEYVVFDYDMVKVELGVERFAENYQEYESLDLQSIDKPVIILHRKYIHKLHILSDFECEFDFEPTRSITIDVFDDYKHKS